MNSNGLTEEEKEIFKGVDWVYGKNEKLFKGENNK